MGPLVFPEGERLNVYAGLQQNIVRKIGHGQLGINEWPFFTSQDYGDIRVTIGAMAAACAAAKQHGVMNRIARVYKADEGFHRPFGRCAHHRAVRHTSEFYSEVVTLNTVGIAAIEVEHPGSV